MQWLLEVDGQNESLTLGIPTRLINEEDNRFVVNGDVFFVRFEPLTGVFFLRKEHERLEHCVMLSSCEILPRSTVLSQEISLHFAKGAGSIKAKLVADLPQSLLARTKAAQKERDIVSPLSGKVLKVMKKIKDTVKAGEVVLVIEAMKMENQIVSPSDGVIHAIHPSEGTILSVAAPLFTVKSE